MLTMNNNARQYSRSARRAARRVLYPDSYRPRSSLYPDNYRPGRPPYSRNRPYDSDTSVDVLLYSPLDARDPRHWALHVRSPRGRGSVHQIYDDDGGAGYYVAPVRWRVEPSRARLFTEGINVGRIRRWHLRQARRIMGIW
ncbi:hypothetical protein F5Y04DRAFT_255439 [Hypomontagnella monticulosa]|nr:hypothetical protein F5Y04DRAFT_255439 [Hypomontagnella monticulosa]